MAKEREEEAERQRRAEEERQLLEEKERIKRERQEEEARKVEEARKIEEAKKTIADSGKALGRNAGSGMVSSGGAASATYTSEYTEDLEEKKSEPVQAKPATKQVDRQTWKEAKPKLQDLVDSFGVNVYKSNSFTIKSV